MEKYKWNKIGNDFIFYSTVNLNIFEVGYLFDVWEMYNTDVWDNNKGQFEAEIKESIEADRKAFIGVENKFSAETFLVDLIRADRTYHTDKAHWLQIYDKQKEEGTLSINGRLT